MRLSRRELLTTFLGAPLAAAACRTSAPDRYPDGEIVGQNADLGHILRDGRAFDASPSDRRRVRVAIVGAGVAGLAAAWQLRRAGINDVVVLELESAAGGTSRSGTGNPVPFPWGAHYLPVPFAENTELIELLEEMSLVESRGPAGEVIIREQFLCRQPEERVFYKGRWYEGLYLHAGAGAPDEEELRRFQAEVDRLVGWRDARGRRAFSVPAASCSDDAEVTALDGVSFADWLRRHNFTSERLWWYCDYACRDDYGLTVEQTSAWAGLFYFCSRVRVSGAESQPFITFPEGNGRFINHLAGKIGDSLLRSHAVVSVTPSENTAAVVCMHNGRLTGLECDHVIYAAPVFTAPYVIRGFRRDAPFNAGAFRHNAWFVANLFLRDRPKPRFARDFPLAWDNVLYESPSLGYVTATHQKGIDYGPTVLTYYYPMCHEPEGRTKLFEYSWRELADVCFTDIGRAHPEIRQLCDRIDIMRWGHAMISPYPGFIWGNDRRQAAKPYRNIHFAHADLSGIALFEEAFYHGTRAAREVAEMNLTPPKSETERR